MATLDGVNGKLARAEKHITVATRLIKYFARHECRVEREVNPQTRQIDAVLRVGTPPMHISIILGDAIHNLRSALDHTVYQLVLSNPTRPTDTPNDKTMFPLCDTVEGFRRQVDKLGRLRGVAVDPAAIIDELQPYHRRQPGRDYTKYHLWILNKLENIDKHRRLTMTAGVAFDSLAHISVDGEVWAEHASTGEMMRDGTTLFSFSPPLPGQPDMNVKGRVLSFVAFDEPAANLANADAAYVCRQILEFIRAHVVPRLAPFIA